MRLQHLLDFLFPPRSDEAVVREISEEHFLGELRPMLCPYTRPATVALFPFSTPAVRAAIHEAKYHGNERTFTLLGAALADYLPDAEENYGSRKLVIIPVPLGVERRKQRGFNQIEEVAKCAVRELRIPIDTTLLARTRETESQVSLARKKREENMKGAFAATREADPAFTYIVIDDVITTGATLQAALDALTAAGASHLVPLALAH